MRMFSFTGYVLSEKDKKKNLPSTYTKFYAIERTWDLAYIQLLLNTDIVNGELKFDSDEYPALNKDWK